MKRRSPIQLNPDAPRFDGPEWGPDAHDYHVQEMRREIAALDASHLQSEVDRYVDMVQQAAANEAAALATLASAMNPVERLEFENRHREASGRHETLRLYLNLLMEGRAELERERVPQNGVPVSDEPNFRCPLKLIVWKELLAGHTEKNNRAWADYLAKKYPRRDLPGSFRAGDWQTGRDFRKLKDLPKLITDPDCRDIRHKWENLMWELKGRAAAHTSP